MKIKTFITLTIIFLLLSFSCKETPPEPGNGSKGNGMLIVEDVGVTDAVLRLRVPGGLMNRVITLRRQNTKQQNDTATIFHSQLTTHRSPTDTLIIDESLLPKQSYRYALTLENIFNLKERSYADIVTLDTTSHNFTWQIDTLGDGNSSVLYDVAIINDTCVYAVGEIYKRDSLGNWNNIPYNFLKWDGKNWEMKSITSVPVRSIFVFSDTNIWAGTSGPYHWDGVVWRTFKLDGAFNGYVNKFWGTSSSNMYMCGTNGALAHFDGTSWQKLEGGTDVNLTDVWGSPDGKEIYCSGGDPSKGRGIILKMINGNWTKIIESFVFGTGYDETKFLKSQLFGSHRGIWVDNHKTVYTVGDFVFQNRYGQWRYAQNLAGNNIYASGNHFGYLTAIRGNAVNDIVIVGQQRTILHNNGLSWQHIGPKFEYGNSLNLYGVAMNDRMIIAVGTSSRTAIAIRLYK
jgi:hypothetical protein